MKITEQGYEPNRFTLKQNIPARVIFVRETEATCGTSVVIPEYNIRQELPLKKPVTVEFTPNKAGEFSLVCGMNMLRGNIVVQ